MTALVQEPTLGMRMRALGRRDPDVRVPHPVPLHRAVRGPLPHRPRRSPRPTTSATCSRTCGLSSRWPSGRRSCSSSPASTSRRERSSRSPASSARPSSPSRPTPSSSRRARSGASCSSRTAPSCMARRWASRVAIGAMLRGRRAHRRLQRRRGRLRAHPALHGHAGDVDVLRRAGHLPGQVREHHRPAGAFTSHRRRVRHRRRVQFFSVAMVMAVALASSPTSSCGRTVFGRWLYAHRHQPACRRGLRRAGRARSSSSPTCSAASARRWPRSSTRRAWTRAGPRWVSPFLLDIIAAVVIGGTSLSGGRGKIMWTFFGVIFLTLLGNALSLLNVPFFYIAIVKGSVILFAALIDVARRRIAPAERVRPDMNDTILRFEGVDKAFFGVPVLKGITLDIERGSIVGLVGENGAGKSTLMNILGGVVPLDAGQMLLDGEAYAPRDPRDADRAGIAFIHQELNLFTNLTIAENFFINELPAPCRDAHPGSRPDPQARPGVAGPGGPGRLAGHPRRAPDARRAAARRGGQGALGGCPHHHLRRAHDVADSARDRAALRRSSTGSTRRARRSSTSRTSCATSCSSRTPSPSCATGALVAQRAQVGLHHPQHDRGHGRARHRAALPRPHLAAWRRGLTGGPAALQGGHRPRHRPEPAQGRGARASSG